MKLWLAFWCVILVVGGGCARTGSVSWEESQCLSTLLLLSEASANGGYGLLNEVLFDEKQNGNLYATDVLGQPVAKSDRCMTRELAEPQLSPSGRAALKDALKLDGRNRKIIRRYAYCMKEFDTLAVPSLPDSFASALTQEVRDALRPALENEDDHLKRNALLEDFARRERTVFAADQSCRAGLRFERSPLLD
jgi:hypothetical protein